MAPPVVVLCVAGVALAALLYYYYTADSPQTEAEAPYGAAPSGSSRNKYKSNGMPGRRRGQSGYELEDCSICQATVFPSSMRILACGHCFHIRCMEKWQEVSPICPNCRRPVHGH